jgi:hypothetical protein
VLALLAAAVFAAAAFVLLTAYAPDLRASRGGGAHALSRSAIGYAGAVRLLRLMGEPVLVSESSLGPKTFPVLMVLTPQEPDALGALSDTADRLVVLPKWAAEPDDRHPGWAGAAVLLPARFVTAVLPTRLQGVRVRRRGLGDRPPTRLTSDLGIWPDAGLPAGSVEQFQTIAGGPLQPLVRDEQGDMVLGVAGGGHLYVLSDPDLLDTQGLRDPRTARIAASLLLALRTEGRPIAFDLSATEAGGRRSLLRLAVEPPFVAATACLLMVAALVGLQAWFRFGPAQRAPRAVALGKTALVENGAAMVRLARREARMAGRYVHLCRSRAAAALGAGHLEGAALDEFLDRWAARVGAAERITALQAAAHEVTDGSGLAVLAKRARQWRQEVTGGA